MEITQPGAVTQMVQQLLNYSSFHAVTIQQLLLVHYIDLHSIVLRANALEN